MEGAHLEDVDETDDRKAAQLLLQWLAAQVQDCGRISEDALKDEEGACGAESDGCICAALREIVLERDEVSRYEKIDGISSEAEVSMNLVDYAPPSLARRRAEYSENDLELAQHEIVLLRSRIAQTKQAAQQMSKSVKQFQRVAYDLDAKMRSSEDRLAELSIAADATIASTVTESNELLSVLTGPLCKIPQESPKGNEDLDLARTYLETVRKDLSAITSSVRENEQGSATLHRDETVKIDDVNQQAGRLRKAFASMSGHLPQTRQDELARKEFLEICLALEHEATVRETEMHKPEDLDVNEVLSEAWALDQTALLESEEGFLDQILVSLGTILEPLERVQSSLSQLPPFIEEAEALIETFGEELGDINLDNLTENEGVTRARRTRQDVEMEKELKRVLNENKELRPQGAPPLLLLTREDILEELHSMKPRQLALEKSEMLLLHDISRRCSARPINAFLPKVYANSPLNTSTPFAFPAYVQDLEKRTRTKTAELHNLASASEEEVREAFAKSSNTKRLDAFIDKWSGENPSF
ncbi:unnamed protein product [Cyclocybe aegerita]|uniref:Uncharacterized protein n=1 Tax=Cyclocybe aegerita TaxID=1973307 RepID=A0A8S0WJW3_CYCAE|nr:unnamed protein product [Cyclocybe aegerita]